MAAGTLLGPGLRSLPTYVPEKGLGGETRVKTSTRQPQMTIRGLGLEVLKGIDSRIKGNDKRMNYMILYVLQVTVTVHRLCFCQPAPLKGSM